jgi:hypothetical protein
MKPSLHPLLLATLAVVLAFLTGCATSPPPISSAQTLSGQAGAVVIRLITNGAEANDPTETLSSLTLKRDVPPGVQASAEDTAILRRTREMTNSTAVFSGMVAPGRYRLSHANGFFANTTYTFPLAGRLGSQPKKSMTPVSGSTSTPISSVPVLGTAVVNSVGAGGTANSGDGGASQVTFPDASVVVATGGGGGGNDGRRS